MALSLALLDIFSTYQVADRLLRWTEAIGGQAATARQGAPFSATTSFGLWISTFPVTGDTAIYELVANPTISTGSVGFGEIQNINGNDLVSLKYNTSGVLTVSWPGGSLTETDPAKYLSFGNWYHIAVAIYRHATSGAVEVRVNNTVQPNLTVSGINTIGSSSGTCARYKLANVNLIADWIAVQIGTGGFVSGDFFGDRSKGFSQTTADGTYTVGSNWANPAGANWAALSEQKHDGDTSFIQNNSAVAGGVADRDSWAIAPMAADCSTAAGAIACVQDVISVKGEPAGATGTIEQFAIVGGTDYDQGVNKTFSSAQYLIYTRPMKLSPDTGAAWTIAEYNASQMGVILKTLT